MARSVKTLPKRYEEELARIDAEFARFIAKLASIEKKRAAIMKKIHARVDSEKIAKIRKSLT